MKKLDRAQKTAMILGALRKTWQQQEESSLVRNPEHLAGILRGGCEAYLAGDFDPAGDGLSLGLAFLTLARDAMLDGGEFEAIIARGAQGEA